MTMVQINELHNLPRQKKIQVAQMLWEDIAQERDSDAVSAEHIRVLEERIKKINEGKAVFKSWEEVKKKYR